MYDCFSGGGCNVKGLIGVTESLGGDQKIPRNTRFSGEHLPPSSARKAPCPPENEEDVGSYDPLLELNCNVGLLHYVSLCA